MTKRDLFIKVASDLAVIKGIVCGAVCLNEELDCMVSQYDELPDEEGRACSDEDTNVINADELYKFVNDHPESNIFCINPDYYEEFLSNFGLDYILRSDYSEYPDYISDMTANVIAADLIVVVLDNDGTARSIDNNVMAIVSKLEKEIIFVI